MARPSIRWVVREAFERAGLRGPGSRVSPHSLRHTAGTTARLGGAEIRAVQEMLDHRDINTTLKYDHAVNRMRDAPERIVAEALLNRGKMKEIKTRSR